MFIIPLILIVIVIVYLVAFFNGLKTSEVQINASVQEIGNQLKRQTQLIPNLVESVKGFMKQEKGIFDSLTEARKLIGESGSTPDMGKIDKAQDLVNKALSSLRVVVESNPEIKSATLVSDLMNELRDTADKVMYARRLLIDLSADFNIRISTIPGVWLAPLFGFTAKKGLDTPVSGEFLSVNPAETETPNVKLN